MYFEKLKNLISSPTKFYKDVAKEKDYWTVLKFFAVVYIIAWIVQILISIPINRDIPQIRTIILLIAALVGIIGAFVGPFIVGVFTHLGVLVFGGRMGFFNTFKASTYGIIVIFFYGILSSITKLIFLANPPISTFVSGLVSIIGVIHMLTVQSIGVSMYHSISKARAFCGVILIPLILSVIIFALGLWFLQGLQL